MFANRFRPILRRLALVLAAAQVVAYVAVPVLEAATERNPGPAHIEPAHSDACIPVHAPDACLACQLLTAQAVGAEPARIPRATDQSNTADADERNTPAPRPPPTVQLSRAPPTSLA